jgi:zinc protease
VARFHIVGDVSESKVLASLSELEQNWKARDVSVPTYEIAAQPDQAELYFVDIPNAKQSVINIGYLAKKRTDDDFFAATVMNYKLGGSFNGNVNMILREEKGYTYGARTFFRGSEIVGPFIATASVRTNATLESVQIFKEEMEKYREGISEEDLKFTKNALLKSNARRFETYGALLDMIETMSAYGLSPDYIEKEQEVIKNMTLEQHRELAQKYIVPDKMIYLVVGDAATQFERFEGTGFDKVQLIDKEANDVQIPVETSPTL